MGYPTLSARASPRRSCAGRRSELLPRLYLGSGLFRGLFSRSVISHLGVTLDGRQSLGRFQLDFDLPPLVTRIPWFIPEDILITQLRSDFGSDIGQIGQLRDREDAATRRFYEF